MSRGQRWRRPGAVATTRDGERPRPTEGPACRTCEVRLYPEEVFGGDGDQCSPCLIRARRGGSMPHVIPGSRA